MKVLVEVANKKISNYVDCCDALLLGLENFSVLNSVTFSVDEIRKITKDYPDIDVFVKMDKNLFNDEINDVRHVLQELEQMSIRGVFFYDLAILELKQELSLSLDLVWSQTHMVTNYRTCDYYYQQGVHYALLSKEITLDEILAIVKKSSILSIVEVVSLPSVGYSRRKLLSNYYKDLEEDSHSTLSILEKITDKKYLVKEEDEGTGIFLDEVLNGTSVIKPLYEAGFCHLKMVQKHVIMQFSDTKIFYKSIGVK